MAVTATYGERFINELFEGGHEFSVDTFKIALLNTSYAFDPAAYEVWSDISTYELANGNGYTTGGITLTGLSQTIGEGTIIISCSNNPTWTASGGAIPTTAGACIYNTSVSNTIVMVIDFGASYDTADGKMFQVNLSNGILAATFA